MRIIAVEEHWTTPGIDRAQRARPAGDRDGSLVLNDRGDIPAQLLDLGELRRRAMDEAGVAVQIVSLAPPGTNGLPRDEAIALSREANDRASAAVTRFPDRLRTMTSLPMADPGAAADELRRTAGMPGHVGVMSYGRCGDRPLDHPANDELLALAAALRRPVFLHPQIPPDAVRDASFGGLDPLASLGLATFGWGWHLEAGTAALRLILAGTFDRHPELQIVLGHWGEMLLFALDRIDGLSNVAPHLERRVADYVRTNVHVATSGMTSPRLLRHALDFTTADRILLSGDHPFHRVTPGAIDDLLGTLPDPADRERLAHGNAEALFGIEPVPAAPDDGPPRGGTRDAGTRGAGPPRTGTPGAGPPSA